MAVDAVENTLVGGQVERNKRKNTGEGFGIKLLVDFEEVGSCRDDALEAVLLLKQSRPDINETRLENGFNFILNPKKVVFTFAVDRDVKPDVKNFLLGLL